ncbi:MAG: hypothetical protein ACKVP7_20940 [Hyphomicrobiaceae bacterium]
MKRVLGICVAATVFAGSSLPAQATGGFACQAYDSNVAFDFGGATARDAGAPIVHAGGMIQINGGPQAQIDRTHIVQYWNDVRSFRMVITINPPQGTSIQLNINAAGNGDWTYAGSYSVRAGQLQRSGRVTCDARG